MELAKNIFFNTDKLIENTKVKISYTGKFFQDASEEDNSLAKNNLQDIISEIYTQTNDEIMTSKEAGNIIIDAYKKVINGITSELDIEWLKDVRYVISKNRMNIYSLKLMLEILDKTSDKTLQELTKNRTADDIWRIFGRMIKNPNFKRLQQSEM